MLKINDLYVFSINLSAYFLSCEDETRRDPTEPSNIFVPEEGLKITKVGSDEEIILHSKFISSVKNSDQIFIYCTSDSLDSNLFDRFNAPFCVEIDWSKFEWRIKNHIKKKFRRHYTYLNQKVDYYNPASPPETRHADPKKIVFSKPDSFSVESEFRFAFSQNQDSFNVNNVSYCISEEMPISDLR